MISKKFGAVSFVFVGLVAGLGFSIRALADSAPCPPPSTVIAPLANLSAGLQSAGILPPPAPTIPRECLPDDVDCRRKLQYTTAATHLLQLDAAGPTLRGGDTGLGGMAKVGFTGLASDAPDGDFGILKVGLWDSPGQGGTSLSAQLLKADAQYFCKDPDSGTTYFPLMNVMGTCTPSNWGLRVNALRYQGDYSTGRQAMRWADLGAVYNVLGNGNDIDYLQKRFLIHAGADADTMTGSSAPGSDSAGSRVHVKAGVSAMVRSNNNRWEFNVSGDVGTNIAHPSDWGVQANAQFLYHDMFSTLATKTTPQGTKVERVYHLMDFGVEGTYSHNTDPSHALGENQTAVNGYSIGPVFRMSYF